VVTVMSIEAFLQDIQVIYGKIKEAETEVQDIHEYYVDELKARQLQQLQDIEAALGEEREKIDIEYRRRNNTANADFEQACQQIHAQLTEVTTALGGVVSSWDDLIWENYTPGIETTLPSCIRMGQLDVKDAPGMPPLPALAQFIGHRHIFINSNKETAPYARQLLRTALLRLVLSCPPGSLRLTIVGPVESRTDFSVFLSLPYTVQGNKVHSRPEEIEGQLIELSNHIEKVLQISNLGNFTALSGGDHQQLNSLSSSCHILVLSDFAAGFNEQMIEQLLNIARNGPSVNVYILAAMNPNYQLPRKYRLTDLMNFGTVLSLKARQIPEENYQSAGEIVYSSQLKNYQLTWNDQEFGKYSIIPDVPPPDEQVHRWFETMGQMIQEARTHYPFHSIAISEGQQWVHPGLEHLRVPIGANSAGEIHLLELGKGVAHHGLIGGTIGSGKSNMLRVLIIQLALYYSPQELELYLLDFKDVTEFQDYVRLPHARVVALESEREFGLSVLTHLAAELEQRGRMLKSAAVNSRVDYCRKTGQPMPLVTLIMDDFQTLFSSDQDDIAWKAREKLEELVKRGHSFGMHVILCSQSPSLTEAFCDRIYARMGLRIALKCPARDAQIIIGEGSDAVQQLGQPGEAIYNDEMGSGKKNELIRVAFLSLQEQKHYLEQIQSLAAQQIAWMGRSYPTPITFEKRTLASLEDSQELQELLAQPHWLPYDQSTQVWLGQPIAIKRSLAATFERYPGSNLLIVGGNETDAYSLLLATLLSLAAQRSPVDTAFFIADFARPQADSTLPDLFTNLKSRLPHSIEVANIRTVGAMLSHLNMIGTRRFIGEEATSQELYFLIAGLHRWHDLRRQDDLISQLLYLAEEGPDIGIHVIAWIDGFTTIERTIKQAGIDAFELRTILRVSETDSNVLLESPIASRLEDHRAFFHHQNQGSGQLEKFKPYAIPEPDALANLLERIRAKVTL
jgi:DNA segregation ATPase FtsK/SpoIIIE, S-DNA-T family